MKDTIEILGIRVNLENYDSAIEKVEEHINKKSPTGYVTLMSANNLVIAQRDPFFKEISNRRYKRIRRTKENGYRSTITYSGANGLC